MQALFAITPLNWVEWQAVLYLSAPVLVIDEILKFISVSLSSMIWMFVILTCVFPAGNTYRSSFKSEGRVDRCIYEYITIGAQ